MKTKIHWLVTALVTALFWAGCISTPAGTIVLNPIAIADSVSSLLRSSPRARIDYKKKAERGDAESQVVLGYEYQQKGKVSEAFKWYMKAAKQGLSYGEYNVGVMYEKGLGIEKDYPEALKWYLKAAKQDLTVGQHATGVMFHMGWGVKKDYSEAFKWYQKAAGQGYPASQSNLGVLYQDGTGVDLDYAKALSWYLKAANQGSSDGMHNVSAIYREGRGVERDYSKAAEWSIKAGTAVNVGTPDSARWVGWAYQNGLGVEQDFGTALEWYNRAAKQGHPEVQAYIDNLKMVRETHASAVKGDAISQVVLGVSFLAPEVGLGVEPDPKKSIEWSTKSARQGNALGQVMLAMAYLFGWGVEDYDKAQFWLSKAKEQSDPDAQKAVMILSAEIYRKGLGVKRDLEKAFNLYSKELAEFPDSTDDYELPMLLGMMYHQGHGVEKDDVKAAELLAKAAKQAQAKKAWNAQFYVSLEYMAKKQHSKAIEHLTNVAKMGDADAQFYLGSYYLKGKAVPKSLAMAYAWWTLAENNLDVFWVFDGRSKAKIEKAKIVKRMTQAELKEASSVLNNLLTEAKAYSQGDAYRDPNMPSDARIKARDLLQELREQQ